MNSNDKYFGAIRENFDYIYILAPNVVIAIEIANHYFKEKYTLIESNEITAIPKDIYAIFVDNNIKQGYLSHKMGIPTNYISRNDIIDEVLMTLS